MVVTDKVHVSTETGFLTVILKWRSTSMSRAPQYARLATESMVGAAIAWEL